MTTQLAFAFGMLAALSIAMVIGIVVSLVKAYKLSFTNTTIIGWLEDIHRRIDEAEKHASMEINNRAEDIHRRIDETHRQFNTNEDELRRLIDSRLDKLESRLTKRMQQEGYDLETNQIID